MSGGALLIAGTTSDAGKSMVVAGLCRLLTRKGIRVAPFKAQNMSNNSVVTVDGGEIGRAQGVQARAAGLAPSTRFNPVLLKPGSDRTSQLVVRGQSVGTVSAADYIEHRDALAGVVADELAALRAEFDVVLCEGAGSPAEINLRATDLANMGLARAANLPVVVVGDIDRGGLLAHLFGTVAVLSTGGPGADRRVRRQQVPRRPGAAGARTRPARGADRAAHLRSRALQRRAVARCRGLGVGGRPPGGRRAGGPARRGLASGGRDPAARISNSTDVEALACEPGVLVRWATDPAEVADADVVVIPGSKATVADLQWLRERGLADAVHAHARSGRTVLGICGGFQMLCRRIDDTVETRSGAVAGLGLLDADIEFAAEKVLRHWDSPLGGYEIHHGRVTRCAEAGWFEADGHHRASPAVRCTARTGTACWTTTTSVAAGCATPPQPPAGPDSGVADDVSVPARRDAQLDVMADLLAAHLDLDAVLGLLDGGPPVRPTVASALRR